MSERSDQSDTDVGARRLDEQPAGGEQSLARDDTSLVRHQEELEVGKASREIGAVHARKRVETEKVREDVPRQVEEFDDLERVDVGEHDSGEIETLPDGSVSIPILEEELIVTKRTIVRERIVVRKRTVTEHQRVEAELRRERIEVDSEGDLEIEGELES